jgi:hypothetical protein
MTPCPGCDGHDCLTAAGVYDCAYPGANRQDAQTMTMRTPVTVGTKRYTVVADCRGVIRIEYENAVSGAKSLALDGATAKKVLHAYGEQEQSR